MAEAELRNMIMHFRVSDLVVLLAFAGRNKTGKKTELQNRALDLLKLKSAAVQHKIQELHNRRYNYNACQLVARPNNYDIPERTHSDRSAHHYEGHVNNSYNNHYNPNVRPQMNQHTNASYSMGKSYIPPPTLTSSNSVLHYTSYCDVKFKDMPFYDILHEIQKPSNLVNSINDRYQEMTFNFTLTAEQANDLAVSRTANGNYDCQLLLRFCLLESSCEQEDNFPPSVCVKMNGKIVPLPNPIPTNRPGLEPKRPSKPVNVTALTKLSPIVSNTLTVSWSATYGRSYVFALYVARQLTTDTLLYRLKSAGVRNPDITTAMIREKLQQGQDCEIATTSLRGSLMCPLGKSKMRLPCRSSTCTHIQCFDASLYIQMNERKPKWICPVCDKPALFKTLAIDGLFMDLAAKVPANCTEVEFDENGSWTPVIPKKEPKEVPKAKIENSHNNKTKAVEVVDLSDPDSDEDWSFSSKPTNGSTQETHAKASPPSATPSYLLSDTASYEPIIPSSSNPYPETMQAVSSILNEMNDPSCILPDTSMPSTSSTSPGLSIPQYPHIPYLESSYNAYQEQTGDSNENQTLNPAYNNFDFFSLLSIPETDSEKSKENEKDSQKIPDVISLD